MLYEAVENGAFARSIVSAQHIDVGAQVPHNVLVSAPQARYFDALDVIG